MEPKKSGKLFIILMIALIAFGSGSFANLLNPDKNIVNQIIPSSLSLDNQQQILTIDDKLFEPVRIKKHIIKNITNNTTTNNTTTNPPRYQE
ncbi:MAG: hypothetical protein FJ150_03325 [Euryarchaeota archaeon]|nr:hypothetical protein [Euryarchaeota archaeon]